MLSNGNNLTCGVLFLISSGVASEYPTIEYLDWFFQPLKPLNPNVFDDISNASENK